mmetsp:Transcript_19744/g.24355  ORF Transcript_19744/g.24355 Transcript_19744/m.24355 type:complete len:136 (-) Transcript_19744:73-480(-)
MTDTLSLNNELSGTDQQVLPGFTVQFDTIQQRRIHFHSRRGEIIYDTNKYDDNDKPDFNRRYSFWTRPNEAYESRSQMRRDDIEISQAILKIQSVPCLDPAFLPKHNEPDRHIPEEKESLISYHGPRIARRIATQ